MQYICSIFHVFSVNDLRLQKKAVHLHSVPKARDASYIFSTGSEHSEL